MSVHDTINIVTINPKYNQNITHSKNVVTVYNHAVVRNLPSLQYSKCFPIHINLYQQCSTYYPSGMFVLLYLDIYKIQKMFII